MAHDRHRHSARNSRPGSEAAGAVWMLMLATALATALATGLTACGGGSDTSRADVARMPLVEAGAPVASGDTAIDGARWINFRRAQVGLAALSSNSALAAAAQAHANYQQLNNTIGHSETPGLAGYSGADLGARLRQAGYLLVPPYATGEVIAAGSSRAGFVQAEELVTAIYHRFLLLEPAFRELGTGAASTAGGYSYFTADLASNGGYGGQPGQLVNYPSAAQTMVARNFFSDSESPDPVPAQNEVGYPVSVHGRLGSVLTVQRFTLAARGGAPLVVRQLSHASDAETPASAAAIIALAPLAAGTIYDAEFAGQLDGVAVSRSWYFTTR